MLEVGEMRYSVDKGTTFDRHLNPDFDYELEGEDRASEQRILNTDNSQMHNCG